MKYVVQWSRQAADALAELWVSNANLRSAITLAAGDIDRLLSANPNQEGESRGERNRILFVPPLAVDYIVDEPDRLVRVLKLRQIRRRGMSK